MPENLTDLVNLSNLKFEIGKLKNFPRVGFNGSCNATYPDL